MARYVDVEKLIAEYDRVHIGAAGGARKLMEEAPTADVQEVKHGEWMFNRNQAPNEPLYFCPFCVDGESNSGKDNYCPNCGRKMDMNKE
ncbi:MAG: hypothetical protein J6Q61_06675 [Bacteroidales bacterium]|nr:hypothetical protein [Bacteroidales bacterium]